MMPKITKLNIPNLIKISQQFDSTGKIEASINQLTYLKINDEYIHELFPLLHVTEIKKPNYFGDGLVGAHISLIYPEENQIINPHDLGQKHHFKIKDIIIAELGVKKYYALLIESPSLLQFRRKYNLDDNLCFKGYSIGFHITIGIST
jgi:hypothetical protein